MNLFGTVLTNTAPSANYRGESAENRTVIQRITKGRFEYAIISPEAMRNALREIFRTWSDATMPSNRERMEPKSGGGKEGGSDEDKQQLAVKFAEYPDSEKFIDDFFFGYMLAIKGAELTKLRAAKGSEYPLKRDSVIRMNMAIALEPYRHDSVFTQSPLIKDSPWKPGGGDQKVQSALLHRETTVTAFQYPFALNLNDCRPKPEWTKTLLSAIGQLNDVAGNHARSYFEFAPASIVLRHTPRLVAGYDTYGFKINEKGLHEFPEVIEGILKDDFLGSEFCIGGKVVKDLSEATFDALAAKGVHLDRSPQRLLEKLGEAAFPPK